MFHSTPRHTLGRSVPWRGMTLEPLASILRSFIRSRSRTVTITILTISSVV